MAHIEIISTEAEHSGLYGRVYKGRQTRVGNRQVAIKIIKSEWSQAADAVEHAKKLVQAGAHPNVVTVYGVEDVYIPDLKREVPAVIMEWLEGKTLGTRLEGEAFALDEVGKICMGVLDGIDFLHKGGVAHGDLHYANLILLADNTPKIIDIDPNKNISLGRLSTISRVASVNSDLGYCREMIMVCLRHAKVPLLTLVGLNAELVKAESIEDLRHIVNKALAAESEPEDKVKELPGSLPSGIEVKDTHADVAAKVRELVEKDTPASLDRVMLELVTTINSQLLSEDLLIFEGLGEEEYRRRTLRFEEIVKPILLPLAIGARWGKPSTASVWKECIGAIANVYVEKPGKGNQVVFRELQKYPALLMFYATGFGAFQGGNFSTLKLLIDECTLLDGAMQVRMTPILFDWKQSIQTVEIWNSCFPSESGSGHSPVSDRLLTVMFDALGELTFNNRTSFVSAFDEFEFFIGLADAEHRPVQNPEEVEGPYGSFIRHSMRFGNNDDILGKKILGKMSVESESAVLKAGFFRGDVRIAETLIQGYQTYLRNVRSRLGIGW